MVYQPNKEKKMNEFEEQLIATLQVIADQLIEIDASLMTLVDKFDHTGEEDESED